MKIFHLVFTSLLTLLSIECKTQTIRNISHDQSSSEIKYTLHLKGIMNKAYPSIETMERTIHVKEFKEEQLIEFAELFVQSIFAHSSEELISYSKTQTEYLQQSGNTEIRLFFDESEENPISYYIQDDTIYQQTEWSKKPYLSKNGNFNFSSESFEVFNAKKREYEMQTELHHESFVECFSGLEFYENWSFNEKTGVFHKTIKQLFPTTSQQNDEFPENIYNVSFLCSLPPNPQKANHLWARDINYWVKIVPELLWNECTEGIDPGMYFLPAHKRYAMIASILNSLKKENIQAFALNEASPSMDYQANFSKELNYEQSIDLLSNSAQYTLGDILYFGFHEDWYLDESSFSFTKVVKGIYLIPGDENEILPKLYLKLN